MPFMTEVRWNYLAAAWIAAVLAAGGATAWKAGHSTPPSALERMGGPLIKSLELDAVRAFPLISIDPHAIAYRQMAFSDVLRPPTVLYGWQQDYRAKPELAKASAPQPKTKTTIIKP